MDNAEKVNILLVDDQPAKLTSYNVVLEQLGENLLTAASATEALATLLKTDVAVLLVDVCMPDLDGFQLAQMIREHPRFRKTAIIFVSAIHLSDTDSLRGYELGGVDYVPVPVIPEVLRAKVRVFVELYRKSKQLERMNNELEQRVAERTMELEKALQRQELLSKEVDHRAKNALAVVQSIVSLTRAGSVNEFAQSVHGRIRAMANAHALLARSRWAGADLHRLVKEEFAPYGQGERVSVLGPRVSLSPAVAQTLAIAIHELATNAAKYGALSSDTGHVALNWKLERNRLTILWSESGGPPVTPPTSFGFGTKVLEASLGPLADGDVRFDWRPEGLLCTFSILEAFREPTVERLTAPPPHPDDGPTSANSLAGTRVMIVEDEAIVALVFAEVLTQHGANIVGPFRTLDEALACEEDVDGAILDVNLAGKSVQPLAERMARRAVPVIFVTGYETTSLGDQFNGATVLQKPIEATVIVATLARKLGRQAAPLPRTALSA